MTYTLIFTKEFHENLKKLDNSIKQRLPAIFEKIKAQPRLAKPLHGKWDYYSERFLNYRILYTVNDKEKTIIMLEIGKRDSIYRR